MCSQVDPIGFGDGTVALSGALVDEVKVGIVSLLIPCKTQLVPLLIYRVLGVTPVLRYEEPSGLGSGVVLSEGTPEPVVKVSGKFAEKSTRSTLDRKP